MKLDLPPDLLAKLRACRERPGWSDAVTARDDAFLLDAGLGPPGYLTADGRVLVDGREWDGSALREAREDEAHQFLVVGARKTGIEELLALLPPAPAESLKCPRCHGTRWANFGPGRGLVCWTCHGRGWVLPPSRHDAFAGCLLGTAFGDGMGLPFEGLSPARRHALFGRTLGFRLLPGRAMGSDDTEHTCHLARALLRSRGDVEGFRRALANSLRGWFLCLPAGIGKATAIGCLTLLVGFPADCSGAFSAGNGPAMRSAVLGLMIGDQCSAFSAQSAVIRNQSGGFRIPALMTDALIPDSR